MEPDVRDLAGAMLTKAISELKKKNVSNPRAGRLEDIHVDETMPAM